MLGQSMRRCMSTSAIRAQLVKTPVQVHGVEGRYAGALYSAASKEKNLDAVEKKLKDIKQLYHSDKKFREFVLDPTLKRSDKKGQSLTAASAFGITAPAAMEDILKKLGGDPILSNFFGVVAENGRLTKLDAIAKSFATIMSAHRGEVLCTVVSAKELDSSTTKQLEGVLKSFVKSGQTLHITKEVDPSILGGLIINIGDKYVDMSLASKFRHYEKLIAQAV